MSYTYNEAFKIIIYINIIIEIILIISSLFLYKNSSNIIGQIIYCGSIPIIMIAFSFCPIGIRLTLDFDHGELQVVKYNCYRCNYCCTRQRFSLNTVTCFTVQKIFVPYKKFFKIKIKDIEGKETELFTAQDMKGAFCCSSEFDPKIDRLVENLNRLLRGDNVVL